MNGMSCFQTIKHVHIMDTYGWDVQFTNNKARGKRGTYGWDVLFENNQSRG